MMIADRWASSLIFPGIFTYSISDLLLFAKLHSGVDVMVEMHCTLSLTEEQLFNYHTPSSPLKQYISKHYHRVFIFYFFPFPNSMSNKNLPSSYGCCKRTSLGYHRGDF